MSHRTLSSLARSKARFGPRLQVALAASLVLPGLAACESEVPPPPKAGETCWPAHAFGESGDDYCPLQACFTKRRTFSANDVDADGFRCSIPNVTLCTPPTPEEIVPDNPFVNGRALEFRGADFRLVLAFDNRLMRDGYSLENFRKYSLSASIHFSADPTFRDVYAFTGRSTPGSGAIDFVSFENERLHVRVDADAYRANTIIDTPDYLCYPNGPSLDICTTKDCVFSSADDPFYQTQGKGESIHASADVTALVQAIMP